jgi:aryl-alcohol dehydrogenase-like predicted oxidoreductase
MSMSGLYGSSSDADAIAAVHRALDLGITLLDTADVYGDGHNEQLVGRALAGRRDGVIVATKFGNTRTPTGDGGPICGTPEYVRSACEASLRRLGLDTIDLYQQHRVDPRTPIEETIGAVGELIAEGKVRYVGLSEARPSDIRRAAAVHPIASLQSEYSLLERGVEGEVLDTCEELGIGFLAFAPLLRGLLGGSLTPDRALDDDDLRARPDRFPRVGSDHLAANAGLAATVAELAAAHGATGAQLALAWLLDRRPWIVPIPGTKHSSYVEDNAGAPELVLTDVEHRRLDEMSARVSGSRYGAGGRLADWTSPPLPA